MDSNKTILKDFIAKHPFAAAKVLEKLNSEEVAGFLQSLSHETGLLLLKLMNPEVAAECFILFPSRKAKEVLERGDISVLASLLKLIPEPANTRLLADLSPSRLQAIKRKLAFNPNTIGAFAERPIIANKEMGVPEAIELFKRSTEKEEFYLHVVNLDGVLEGIVRPKELLLANRTDTLESSMITNFPKLVFDTPVKSVLANRAWSEYSQIPVVDDRGVLLGSLSYKTLIDSITIDGKKSTNGIIETGSALGELYRIGLSGLLQSPNKP
jgi:Mg/Co/Ni transporter MgtE